MNGKLVMKVMAEVFGVCRLDNNQPIPNWAINSRFYSVTRSYEELSIVCSQEDIPDEIKCEQYSLSRP